LADKIISERKLVKTIQILSLTEEETP